MAFSNIVLLLFSIFTMSVLSDLTDNDVATIVRLIKESMDESIQKSEARLTAVIKSGFEDSHFFSRRRVRVLEQVTVPMSFGNSLSGTGHILLRNGKVATIFTPQSRISMNEDS